MIHGVRLEQIEKELAMAEAALRETNEGKARVCARRAVALAAEASLERFPRPGWRGDAMHHIRHSTKITPRDTAPFTSNPIADAKLIIAYLISAEHERKS